MRFLKVQLFGLLIFFSVNVNAQDKWMPTRIYYVRHAQTVANATNTYTTATESQFSELGNNQKYKIDTILQSYSFDKIIVSPTWRTQNTVYPYLKSTNQKAEIWPELTECCWQSDTSSPTTAVFPVIPWGAEISVIDNGFFSFKRPSANREYNWEAKNYKDGINQCRLAADSIKTLFGGKGLNILIVGHSIQGRKMIEILTGKTVHINNASIDFYLLEQRDGTFKLISLPE